LRVRSLFCSKVSICVRLWIYFHNTERERAALRARMNKVSFAWCGCLIFYYCSVVGSRCKERKHRAKKVYIYPPFAFVRINPLFKFRRRPFLSTHRFIRALQMHIIIYVFVHKRKLSPIYNKYRVCYGRKEKFYVRLGAYY